LKWTCSTQQLFTENPPHCPMLHLLCSLLLLSCLYSTFHTYSSFSSPPAVCCVRTRWSMARKVRCLGNGRLRTASQQLHQYHGIRSQLIAYLRVLGMCTRSPFKHGEAKRLQHVRFTVNGTYAVACRCTRSRHYRCTHNDCVFRY
jgi:hypothetical protein